MVRYPSNIIVGDTLWPAPPYLVQQGAATLFSNGYYIFNNKVYHVSGGVVDTVKTCASYHALNKISSGDFGNAWISNMVDRKENFNIEKGSWNHRYESTAIINYEEKSLIATTAGDQEAPDYVRIGHELAHVYSYVLKFNDASEWALNVTKDEWYASTVENMLRSDQNDPLRETYTNDPWPWSNEDTRLISKTPKMRVGLDGKVVFVYQIENVPEQFQYLLININAKPKK